MPKEDKSGALTQTPNLAYPAYRGRKIPTNIIVDQRIKRGTHRGTNVIQTSTRMIARR